ncbi:MAG TPA: 30S ribosomal protein S8 [Chthoniobacterales bacterium]|nr:30S ribosomal protein S8 [Chthoniobacterales bacterium]
MSNLSDPIADFLTRLRNAARTHRNDVTAPYSRIKEEIAGILKREGYISEFEIDTETKPAQIKVTMKFVNRTSALTGLKRVSRPGLRKYVGSADIPRVLGGMGVAILSTSRGIITGREARKEKVGGELLALVW